MNDLTGRQHGSQALFRDLTLRPFPEVPWGRQAGVGRLSSIFCPVIIRFADKWGLLIKGIKRVLPRVITVTVNQT